jgi:hypothetical protein
MIRAEEMPHFEYTDRIVYDVSQDYQIAKRLCAKMFLMEKITKRLDIYQNTLQQTVFVCRYCFFFINFIL